MKDSAAMDLPPDVPTIVRARLAPDAADRFLALARPSVGFTALTGVSAGGSTIGGTPRTEPFTWPTYLGEPMLLLAQVDCAQVTSLLGAPWPFPAEGYLLFFHDDEFRAPFDMRQGDDGCRVLHVPAGSGAESIATIPAVALDATTMPSLPHAFDDAGTAAGIGIIEAIDLWTELQPVLPQPRHRLLGYCDTDTTHPHGHRPLLQIEAEQGTTWGEVVNISFWITDADLKAGQLDRVRRCFEVA